MSAYVAGLKGDDGNDHSVGVDWRGRSRCGPCSYRVPSSMLISGGANASLAQLTADRCRRCIRTDHNRRRRSGLYHHMAAHLQTSCRYPPLTGGGLRRACAKCCYCTTGRAARHILRRGLRWARDSHYYWRLEGQERQQSILPHQCLRERSVGVPPYRPRWITSACVILATPTSTKARWPARPRSARHR